MNFGYTRICLICSLTTLSPARCNIPPRSPLSGSRNHHLDQARARSAWPSLQIAATQTPACLNSVHPSHSGALIWVSSTLLLFFSEPEIWHPNYLRKKALKLACISQQKYMSRENGQSHCRISLLSFCNQTTLWRQALHFNNYLMTHLHVSMCCQKHAVIFLCATELLQSSTYHS